MLAVRVIPCLSLLKGGLVKTIKFKNPTYVGDPINAVKIFNDKEVDELVVLDIGAPRQKTGPNFSHLETIAVQAFMPMAYGGGIRSIDEMKTLFRLGFEKVVLNTIAFEQPKLVAEAADRFGSQSVVVSIDVKQGLFGRSQVYVEGGKRSTGEAPETYAVRMAELGAGEIILNSIDRDGTMSGYDIALIEKVTKAVKVPVVAIGGAGSVAHFSEAVKKGGASAVSAGSMFVFHGRHRAVLITYPSRSELEIELKS